MLFRSSLDALTWSNARILQNTSSTFTYANLPTGKQLWFRITPLSTRGDGTPSLVSALPTDNPTAVTKLIAVPGDGQMTLSWNAPTYSGGLAIIGYRIEVSNPVTSTSVTYPSSPYISSTGNSNTTFTVMGLSNTNVYSFRVTAINAGGSV